MKYNPRTKSLMISAGDLDQSYMLIMYALKNLRSVAGLPLTPYAREGRLTDHDHAAIAIIELGESLGIHFDVSRHNHNKLDLSNED